MRVKFWESASGRCPVEDFIAKQHKTAAQRIMKDIDYFEQRGLQLLTISPSTVKQLHGYKKLYELKTNWSGIGYRIIFCVINNEAWLLEGFKKKGNSTPRRYIDTALRRKAIIASTG